MQSFCLLAAFHNEPAVFVNPLSLGGRTNQAYLRTVGFNRHRPPRPAPSDVACVCGGRPCAPRTNTRNSAHHKRKRVFAHVLQACARMLICSDKERRERIEHASRETPRIKRVQIREAVCVLTKHAPSQDKVEPIRKGRGEVEESCRRTVAGEQANQLEWRGENITADEQGERCVTLLAKGKDRRRDRASPVYSIHQTGGKQICKVPRRRRHTIAAPMYALVRKQSNPTETTFKSQRSF